MIEVDTTVALYICVGVFIVVFLLLFLLYREKLQRMQLIVNNYGNMNITPHSTLQDQFSKKDDAKSLSEGDPKNEKAESPVTISEKVCCGNQEARANLRHRFATSPSLPNTREHLVEETVRNGNSLPNMPTSEATEREEGKVFSECMSITDLPTNDSSSNKKAFSPLHFPDSDKSDETAVPMQSTSDEGLEIGKVENEHSSARRKSTIMSENDLAETVPENSLPEFHENSSSQYFMFNVDNRGCKVFTRYCKLRIPPGATQKPLTITMSPKYNLQARSSGEAVISPFVHFDVQDGAEAEFTKDVTVSLYTGYSAVEDAKAKNGTKGVTVKVLWQKNQGDSLVHIADAYLCQKKFISFTCKHFCGYCIVADRSQFHSMRRNYCYTGYVRESMAATRILHLILFEDCPLMLDETVQYLKDKKPVIDPEKFSVNFDYTLQVFMEDGEIRHRESRKNCDLPRHWGSRFTDSLQFEMENACGRMGGNLKIKYKMFAIHNQNGPHCDIKDKEVFYEWSVPNQHLPSVIHVHDSGIGMQFNQPTQELHQTSVESTDSGVSSGYGSPPANNQKFSSFLPAGFNDTEEGTTTPKCPSPVRPRTPVHSSFNGQVYHSTPHQTDSPNADCFSESLLADNFHSTDSSSHSSGSTPLDSLETEQDAIVEANL